MADIVDKIFRLQVQQFKLAGDKGSDYMKKEFRQIDMLQSSKYLSHVRPMQRTLPSDNCITLEYEANSPNYNAFVDEVQRMVDKDRQMFNIDGKLTVSNGSPGIHNIILSYSHPKLNIIIKVYEIPNEK